MTTAGHDALYFAGLTYEDMGDTANAETYLKKAMSAGRANISSLAKLALANLYVQSGRTPDAIKLLQDLVNKPTDAVPSGTAQLTLASIYQTTDPAKAHQIYAVLKDKDKSAAGEIATQKLAVPPGTAFSICALQSFRSVRDHREQDMHDRQDHGPDERSTEVVDTEARRDATRKEQDDGVDHKKEDTQRQDAQR
jgi:tetratricopeptide (TPR) repeat protein